MNAEAGAANPTAISGINHSQPVTSVVSARIATPAATRRAALSLTGFGNAKSDRRVRTTGVTVPGPSTVPI